MTIPKMHYLLPILLTCVGLSTALRFDIKHKWKYIDYEWESDAQKAVAVLAGTYNESRIIILDAQPLFDERMIVTMPKGIYPNPASLATVSNTIGPGGPLLAPYPDWSYHTATDCSGITHVRRVVVDDYNRMWAVDTGTVVEKRLCPAKVIVFDLKTDKIVQTTEIPDEISLAGNLQAFAIETRGDSLEDVTLYISDFSRPALLIWNGSKIWRLENAVSQHDEKQDILSVGGYDMDLSRVGGSPSTIAVSPPEIFSTELVFFRPLASLKLYLASRSQLLKSDINPVDYYVSNYTMSHQELAGVISSGGIRFGSASTEMTITCWNMLNPLTPEYVHNFETDEENLQFVPALKICNQSSDNEELWVVSNRMTRWAAGVLDLEDYNYRIMFAKVADLVADTVCDPAKAIRSPLPENQTCSVEKDAANAGFTIVSGDL